MFARLEFVKGYHPRFRVGIFLNVVTEKKKCLVIRVGIYLLKALNLFIPQESIVKFICIHHLSQKIESNGICHHNKSSHTK